MKDFAGRIAVITGGGAGIGRELARQLVAEGCHVAICDISLDAMAETLTVCKNDRPPAGTRITSHAVDVSQEDDLTRARDEIAQQHQTEIIHLLFNNAGIGGGNSLIADSREQWERTFNICWGGVYLGLRTFLPMVTAAEQGHIVNVSSSSGIWATMGPGLAHTAYSAAKFAVKGLTEAMIVDLRLHAPHVKCSVVMPGYVGTSIAVNTPKVLRGNSDDGAADDLAQARARMKSMGVNVEGLQDNQIQQMLDDQIRSFVENAVTTAADAAQVILDGVRQERWRILVGRDAQILDEIVRNAPEGIYESKFIGETMDKIGWPRMV